MVDFTSLFVVERVLANPFDTKNGSLPNNHIFLYSHFKIAISVIITCHNKHILSKFDYYDISNREKLGIKEKM